MHLLTSFIKQLVRDRTGDVIYDFNLENLGPTTIAYNSRTTGWILKI